MEKIGSISEFKHYRDEAHLKYEIIRPVLIGQITAKNRAKELQLHEQTLSKYLKHYRDNGYAGLLDQRHNSPGRKEALNEAQKAHMVMLRLVYNGFSLRELATIVGKEYDGAIDHKSVFRILQQYEALLNFSQSEEATEHVLIRFRQYREYTPIVAGRYHIVELLEAGWKVSTISETMQVSRRLVYYWQHRFKAEGILGLYNKPPIRIHFEETVSPAELAFIFENIENNLRIGNYRIKMMLNGQGNIKGHNTIWQIIHLFRDLKKTEKKKRLKMPEEAPLEAASPHEIWFCDIRYLVKYQGDWVYSIIFIDGYSRMILAGEACLKQDLSHIIAVLQKALSRYGCPKRIVSDNGPVFKAHLLERAIDILGIDWHNIEKGKPWQNLMESLFSIECRLLDSYVKASDDLKYIQRQHGRFIDEYNISGHWHHKAYTEDGRIYYKSPQNILGQAKGRVFTSQDLSKTFAFKHHQRIVSRKGQIRILSYILYVDEGLADETVDVYIYPECLQIERDKQVIVEYGCHYDIQTKQLKTVKSDMVFWRPSVSRQLFMFGIELYRIIAFTVIQRRRIKQNLCEQMSFYFGES
jgi:transposase/transposase InsO family protein